MILESYNSVTKLQQAEDRTEAEAGRDLLPPYSTGQENGLQQRHLPEALDVSRTDGLPSRRPPSPEPSLSESDPVDVELDKGATNVRQTPPGNEIDREIADSSDDDLQPTGPPQQAAVRPQPTYNSSGDPGKARVSTLLLQMVPYKSFYTDQGNSRLTIAGPDGPARLGIGEKPVIEEATESIRLLLDKWTATGSAPISDVLVEEAAKDHREA